MKVKAAAQGPPRADGAQSKCRSRWTAVRPSAHPPLLPRARRTASLFPRRATLQRVGDDLPAALPEDPGEALDLAAAQTRADGADTQAMLEALAARLAGALPRMTTV